MPLNGQGARLAATVTIGLAALGACGRSVRSDEALAMLEVSTAAGLPAFTTARFSVAGRPEIVAHEVRYDGRATLKFGYYLPGPGGTLRISGQALAGDCLVGSGVAEVEVQLGRVSSPVALIIKPLAEPYPACAGARDGGLDGALDGGAETDGAPDGRDATAADVATDMGDGPPTDAATDAPVNATDVGAGIDAAPDLAPDVPRDVAGAADAVVDAVADAVLDLAPDLAPDRAADAVADVARDVAPDVAPGMDAAADVHATMDAVAEMAPPPPPPPPPPACMVATKACPGSAECCSGLVCGTTTLGRVCCGNFNMTCTRAGGEDCCGQLECVSGRCCLPATYACSDASCCPGLVCGNTTLGHVCCGNSGAPCKRADGADCCGALECVNGVCR